MNLLSKCKSIMFNEKTLLILGAGASKDYGFPTGNELIFDMEQLLRFEVRR